MSILTKAVDITFLPLRGEMENPQNFLTGLEQVLHITGIQWVDIVCLTIELQTLHYINVIKNKKFIGKRTMFRQSSRSVQLPRTDCDCLFDGKHG